MAWERLPLWRVYEHPRVALWIGLTAVLLTVIAPSISSQQPDTVKSPQSPDSAHTPATAVIDPRAVQPERPTVATHAYTVAPGYVEIEAGVQDARPSGATQFGVPVVVKVGVLPRLQRGPLGGVAELFSYPGTAGPAGMSTMVRFLFGPTLQLRPWLVLDAAYAGFTYNVGRIPGFPSPRRSLDR